jgi:hypothetical protein
LQNIAAAAVGSAAAISDVKAAAELHSNGGTTSADVQRLALLACLRFEERSTDVCAAAKGAAPASLPLLAKALLEFGGGAHRGEELFGGGLLGNVRMMMMSEADISVYMQHVPLLKTQLDACADGKLDGRKYPVGASSCYVSQQSSVSSPVSLCRELCGIMFRSCEMFRSEMLAHSPHAPLHPCCKGKHARAVGQSLDESQRVARQCSSQIVVVMLGGATYSEGEVVKKFNAARRRFDKRCNAVLGATTLLNTVSFTERIKQLATV